MEVKEGGKMVTVENDKTSFILDEETIAAFDVKKGKYTIQTTLSKLILIESATG